jgi:hypothetical protein
MAWMHACREALALLSKARDEPLTRWERWQWGGHRRWCGNCRAAESQFARLHAALEP